MFISIGVLIITFFAFILVAMNSTGGDDRPKGEANRGKSVLRSSAYSKSSSGRGKSADHLSDDWDDYMIWLNQQEVFRQMNEQQQQQILHDMQVQQEIQNQTNMQNQQEFQNQMDLQMQQDIQNQMDFQNQMDQSFMDNGFNDPFWP